MTDKDTRAAKSFYREVRTFADTTQPWEQHVSYQTLPDEMYDLTLVSRRVYGRPDEFLAVMAAAGLDMCDQPLPQRRLTLPTEQQLKAIKQRTGFESRAEYREDGAPTWAVE